MSSRAESREPRAETDTAEVELRGAIAALPDPEIPVITIADLGVLRDVTVTGAVATISITPTYSGCPAMDQIRSDIEALTREHGYEPVVEVTYSPAWTTDWLSDDAKRRLREFGIAPPGGDVLCPQCSSVDARELSRFGSTACKALWVCDSCHEPFDHFKVLAP